MRVITVSLVAALVAALAVAQPVSTQSKAGASQPVAKAAPAPVDLNTATATQLESLPGIGARMAQRIVEHRQKHGGFKKIEELMNVQGIGEKNFLKLKPLITVTPARAERRPSGAF